eukprot:scaffold75277_cov66-Phaeocystis_antarctica.AAC.1
MKARLRASGLGSAATRLMAAPKPASYWPMTNSMSAFEVNLSAPEATRARIRSPKASGAIGGARPAFICPRHVSGPGSYAPPNSVAPSYAPKSSRHALFLTTMLAACSKKHQPRSRCRRVFE